MVAFFQSLHKTLAAGVVLVIVLIILAGLMGGRFVRIDHAYGMFLVRWLHIMTGIMWVGLLWYLNFVQTPTVPKIEPAEHRAAITRFIAPNVLFWFRYSALATVILGLTLALMRGYLFQALTFHRGTIAIGIGMWLALIMAFNVWFIIWPNQQKALGLVQATPEEKAAAGRKAMLASRINTLLSIPMLFCMVAQQNAGL
ncbi:MAG: hypothetical protein QOG83_1939 [Alphaproteobacteria bacterium]|nr:hypothetical protein [Alphaproteobacteria bacterium]